MKRFCFLILLMGFRYTYAQNLVKVINITPGENAVTSSLPFDRPVILKWVSKEPVLISNATLVSFKKGKVSDYYKTFAQENSFYFLTSGSQKEDKLGLEVDIQPLTTTASINSDGKYELNFILPPLEPNRFYDVKFLRRPLDRELDLYVDLFSSITTNDIFVRKLQVINKIKNPFAHRTFDITRPLAVEELKAFYTGRLQALYASLAAANDNAKPPIIAQIKAAIVNDHPPTGIEQAGDYINIFSAIASANQSVAEAAMTVLAQKQLPYVYVPPALSGSFHVGNMDYAAIKHIYDFDTNLQKQVADLNAAQVNDKPMLKHKLELYIISLSLPLADDMFVFGQTLSSSTAVLDFDTRTGYTITPDFGYVYYGFQKELNNMTPYIGFQLEFRYFDKNIPFNLIHPKTLWHYLSFTTGLSLTSLKKEGKRDDLFANKSLLVGLGVRISSATRLTLGGILFNKENVNPLINKKHLTVTPFMGLSIDLKLKSIFNDFYSISPTKKS